MEIYEKNGNILYVLNILKKYSNVDHILSSNKIKELINKEYNVAIDSRTIRRNITLLIEKFNYDIETFSDNNKGYYLRYNPDIEFENGELSAILNTFAYSNFVSERMSDEIIDKCLSMMNVYEREKYKDFKASIKNTRTNNYEIIKNIEDINEAIFDNKKIKFDYYKYSLDSSTLKENLVKKVKTSPYKLVYALQKFYLICLDDDKKELYSYRVDKIKDLNILTNKRNNKILDSEIDFYVKNNVNMFSGDAEKVEIKCDVSLLDNVIELYGKDIKLEKIDDNTFYASFYTTIKGFRYWCLRNIETVKVLSPKSLVKDIKNVLKENL